MADRGLSAARFRGAVAALGTEPCVPAHPTHPPVPCARAAGARRGTVERSWAGMRAWRGVAARYDEAAGS